ncbi:hypothetical protein JCM19239_7054 [Vibrio variabilis]|uniref:Uncharacterized protein n=1 Tax=Vibrio variabilis TaxID=990271 RepID=A0ABQ0JM17_9VIBR|nr:hypothetical protein JCM19239_7054 [Vibrio variabilis]
MATVTKRRNVVLQMRMYEPKAEALDGRWTPAPVQRVSN